MARSTNQRCRPLQLRLEPQTAILLAFSSIILGREHIPVPALVDHTSRKEPREGTFGKVLGELCCLTNLPSRQPVLMLVEQCHNDATALLNIGA